MFSYLLIHLILSITLTLFASYMLKNRFDVPLYKIILGVLLFNLLFPIVGYLLTLMLAPVLSYSKIQRYIHDIKQFNKEEFFKAPYPYIQRLFGEGSVVSLATDKDNHSPNKMKSLVFMAQHPSKQSHRLIRGLLSDPNNEVRLYSFSLLNEKEEALNQQIAYFQKELKEDNNEKEEALIHTQLAHLYWEFIYLSLSEAENSPRIIKEIEQHLAKALAYFPSDASIQALLGKVHFHKKEFQSALEYFHRAIDLGFAKNSLIPYLAEISFEQKQFSKVSYFMQQMDAEHTSFFTNPLYRQWSQA